jgi:hypothetical protein
MISLCLLANTSFVAHVGELGDSLSIENPALWFPVRRICDFRGKDKGLIYVGSGGPTPGYGADVDVCRPEITLLR